MQARPISSADDDLDNEFQFVRIDIMYDTIVFIVNEGRI